MEIENIPITDIMPYEKNPRKNDKAVEIVAKSIKEYGFLVPVILDDRNVIVAGHTRLKAAISLGMMEVPCIYAEGLTEAQIKAFRIMDNKSIEYSDWDMNLLKDELNELKELGIDLDLTGFSETEINKLIKDELLEKQIDETKPKYDIKTGEIWQLGNHRLLCGDCTKQSNVANLCGSVVANLCLTDPPYSVDYKSRKEVTNEVLDSYQDPKDALDLLKSFIRIIPSNILIMTYAERHIPELMKSYEELKWNHIRMLIWKKQHFTFHMGSHYNNIFEPIFIAKTKNAKLTVNTLSNEIDVLEYDRKMKNDLHPTERPLELYKKLLINHSNENDIIYEPFAGSGTTLIACEELGRICYAMEISPAFCSVVIERWENLTGKKAVKSNME